MTILNYEEVSESRRVFQIEIPSEEVEKKRVAVIRNYAHRAAIPGFRKGRVPESVVAKKFAEAIREDILDQLIPEALSEAIREKNVEPLGRPRIEDLKFEEGAPLAFKVNVDIRPAIEPGNYTGVEVHDVSVEPAPEEIEQMLTRLAESHAEFLPIEGRAAKDGDYAIVDIAHRFVDDAAPLLYTGAGEAVPASDSAGSWEKSEKLTLEVGDPEAMPEINTALRGATPGQSPAFRKKFAEDFPNEKYRGKTLDYEVTLSALKEKKLPEINDEFASHLGGVATAAELREKVAEGIRQEKVTARRHKFEREILETLTAQARTPVPQVLLDAETESALEEYAEYLSRRGADPAKANWDKLAADAQPGAQRRVQEYLLLDEVARRESLDVTDTEVDAEIRRSAQRRGVDYREWRRRLEKEGRLGSVRTQLRLQKAVDWLIDHAKVLPPEGK